MESRARMQHRTIIGAYAKNSSGSKYRSGTRKFNFVWTRKRPHSRVALRKTAICRLSATPSFAMHGYRLIAERAGTGQLDALPPRWARSSIQPSRCSRARLSAFDRRDVDRRRIWLSFSQGLHLRHDGLSAAVEGLNMLARRTRKQPEMKWQRAATPL